MPTRPSPNPVVALPLLLAVYFTAQAALRIAIASGVELDEAEQLLWTQQLAWGYGMQPPLYSWLQWLFFELFGVSVFALALLKNLLLFGTYGFSLLAARLVMPAGLAAVAAASMLLLPQIGWDSQRDLTHSVLAATAAAATLWLTLSLLRRPSAARYAGLGVAIAAGCLAKYSYLLQPAALALAAAATPGARQVLRDRRLLLTLGVAALLLAPHALWVLEHGRDAVAGTGHKLAAHGERGLAQIARGLGRLTFAMLAFVTPLWIVLVALFGRGLGARAAGRDPVAAPLLARYLLAVALLLVALVVVGGATRFRDRWMQPYLFCAALIFFAQWPGLLSHPRLPALRRLLVGVALALLLLIGARPLVDSARGIDDDLNLPLRALGAALAQAEPRPAGIASHDKHLAGALRLAFPEAQVRHLPDAAAPLPADLPRPLLLVAPDPQPLPAEAAGANRELELPYEHGEAHPARLRLRYAVLR